ncbi:hypothetical protein SAMN05216243_2200 [Sediminibacillus albus]|uniref:Uncharacterized protein n=1 Tax=Sediminibacillus albus TaxID=407036 RepID=A0A1G8ZUK4_9BACI|nr:hypothetical protein SAMN05216243_2200 [Sediminibacillus albus]
MPFKHFLRSFLRVRTRSIDLPTSEVMAIIKHEKPKIYYSLKKNTANDPIFHFITNINMDYERAHENLKKLRESIQ